MEFNDIHIGMMCGSTKGSGTVTCIDTSTKVIYMSDHNNESFDIGFDDIMDDPQVHNTSDFYY